MLIVNTNRQILKKTINRHKTKQKRAIILIFSWIINWNENNNNKIFSISKSFAQLSCSFSRRRRIVTRNMKQHLIWSGKDQNSENLLLRNKRVFFLLPTYDYYYILLQQSQFAQHVDHDISLLTYSKQTLVEINSTIQPAHFWVLQLWKSCYLRKLFD